MAKKKAKKAETPQTTAQSLGSVVKSCRDIMRKDKGLNGDLDRLPMLTWIMFLKFLDDMERLREQESELSGERFRPVIAAPYRWRDWAAKPDGITGPELIAFINQEKAVRADGSEGPGLFTYLRSLESPEGRGRQEVVANVFRGVSNRMESGYLLRDVLNKVHAIHFDSSEEIHTLSRLYESMLREMRDAAGDSGEFYTPRPVVQFMVEVMNPQLGETVLDPACGTGGFLVEAFQHLEKQCKTTKDRQILHSKSIFGKEAKPLPYLLCEMNLLLHGMESPQIDYENSLAVKVTEIGDRDRVDVILTNPPFGGEEEASIKSGFPQDMQTSETALLFLQLIARMLRRPKGDTPGGRAAVVVPNGTLFGDGMCARIKEDLLKNFNLHTIVRLPTGSSLHIPISRPISCSLTEPDPQKMSGSTNNPCRMTVGNTRKRNRFSPKNLVTASSGGVNGRRMTEPGKSLRRKFWTTTAIWIARIQTPPLTLNTSLQSNSWTTFLKKVHPSEARKSLK
jgi:type I restriction enzyme M protein